MTGNKLRRYCERCCGLWTRHTNGSADSFESFLVQFILEILLFATPQRNEISCTGTHKKRQGGLKETTKLIHKRPPQKRNDDFVFSKKDTPQITNDRIFYNNNPYERCKMSLEPTFVSL